MLPFYRYTAENRQGMDFIALVDNPAHMKGWSAFSKVEDEKVEFKQFFNEEKRVVMGVAIATEVPIYRNDKELGEHYAIFTAKDTDIIWERMMKNGFLHNVNEMHEESKKLEGVYLKHSYAVDSKKGITAPKEFESQNLKDGTIIAFYKVDDDATWAKVKSGEFRGFSIEGFFNKVELKIKNTNMKKNNKGVFSKLKNFLSELEKENFGEATTVDGVNVFWEGELAEGIELKVKGEDGEELLAPEGSHAIAVDEDNVRVVTVDANGIITSITNEAVTNDSDMDEDFDSVKKLLESVFSKQEKQRKQDISTFDKQIVELKKQNENLTKLVNEISSKEDKKKFNRSETKNFLDL